MAPRRLADYIERINETDQTSSQTTARPFNNNTATQPPLIRGRVNRILLFPGSFNPPHQGHLNLLKHVFYNAGQDLNIIAAIIINTDDERLKMKMDKRETGIVLSREQRADLWRGDGIPVDWAWVYDNSEASWAGFRTKLVNELKRDGIDLKFVLLFGPDAITAAGGYNPVCWDCGDAITSDISRPVDFRYPNTLRQLVGCTPWVNLQDGRARFDNKISICRQNRVRPRGTVRFIPCDLDRRPEDAPSSTKIREIIENLPQEEWEEKLNGVALHPKTLVKYLKELPLPTKPTESKEDLAKKQWESIVW
jgi:cytidyltransferase-like protein